MLQTCNDKQKVRHKDNATARIKGYERHSAQRQCYDMVPQIMYQQMVTVINTNNYPGSQYYLYSIPFVSKYLMFEHQLFDYSIILILTLFTNICYLSFST
jgi:hypothetical protein